MHNNSDGPSFNQLGDLQTEIMRIVWEMGEATVHDVKAALEPTRSPAYTTVMTVMSRLAEQGILERRKEGRAYVYTPSESQEQVARTLLRSLVRRFFGGTASSAIAHLLETDENVNEEELRRLEELIRRKREEKER